MSDLSFNEAQALVTKAARGFGCSWGIAQEISAATMTLQRAGAPGMEAFAQYIENAPHPLDLCPIINAIAIIDGIISDFTDPLSVRQPLLLAGIIAGSSVDEAWQLKWLDASLIIKDGTIYQVSQTDNLMCDLVKYELSRMDTPLQNLTNIECSRIRNLTPNGLDILLGFAFKTYAPNTQQSREMGAGSGASDGD